MPKILTHYYPNQEANDNCLVMRPVFVGWSFKGFEPVNRPVYDSCDLFVGV